MELFKKKYDGESVIDCFRDLSEAMDPEFNPAAEEITSDNYGFPVGVFTITIEYTQFDEVK